MFACLHLPDFCLQAQLCQKPGWRWEAVGVLDSDAKSISALSTDQKQAPRILALTEAARESGVEIGMTAPQAQARCGHLRLLPRDRDAESRAQEALLQAAANTSPDFESTAPGRVTVDLGSVAGNYREETLQRIGHQWIAALAEEELRIRTGFAPNPDLASLAVRLPEPVTSFTGDEDLVRESLGPLPLDTLALPSDFLATLTLWGIESLGELTALPRDEVIERLGPEISDYWDQAAGRRQRLLRLVRPPVDFVVAIDFDDELTTLEPLMFRLRRSLETLTARLAGVYLATSEMKLTLRFSDGSAAEQIIRVPDPDREVDRLFQLCQTRLESLSVSRPIEGYQLELQPSRPGEQPFHLFETTLRDPNRFADTLAQLEALVGTENAGSPHPLDTHRPDAFVMRPFEPDARNDNRDHSSSPETFLAAVQGLPLRRYRPPRPIEAQTARDPISGNLRPTAIRSGEVQGPIRHLAGPWPVSGDWWESSRRWRQEEWDIQLEEGSLYRLSFRPESTGDRAAPGWFLEGVYG